MVEPALDLNPSETILSVLGGSVRVYEELELLFSALKWITEPSMPRILFLYLEGLALQRHLKHNSSAS